MIAPEKRERFDDRMAGFSTSAKTKAPSKQDLKEPSLYAPEINGLASLHRSHDSRRNLHGMSTLKGPVKDVDFMTGGTRLQPIVSRGGLNDKRLSEKSDRFQCDVQNIVERDNSVGNGLFIDDVDVTLRPTRSNHLNKDFVLQKTATLCSDMSMQNLQQSTYILDAPVKRTVRPLARDTISDVSSLA